MKTIKIFLLAILIILFGLGCYIAGGINAGNRALRFSDYSALMWITNINEAIDNKKYDLAEKICYDGASLYFFSLKQNKVIHWRPLLFLFPSYFKLAYPNPNSSLFTKPAAFYAPRASKLMPEARDYFEQSESSNNYNTK